MKTYMLPLLALFFGCTFCVQAKAEDYAVAIVPERAKVGEYRTGLVGRLEKGPDGNVVFVYQFEKVLIERDIDTHSLVVVKKAGSPFKRTEIHILTGASNYQKYRVQTPTAIHELDNNYSIAMAGEDLVVVNKSGPKKKAEIHILTATSNYSKYRVQTEMNIHELDDNYSIAMAGQDLVIVKRRGSLERRAEIHILTAASNYQKYRVQTPTGIHELDNNYAIAMAGEDLVVVKKSGPNKKAEIHILTAASNYQKYRVQTELNIHELDDNYSIAMAGQDLVIVKRRGSPERRAEIHILTAASNYQKYRVQTPTGIHELD